MKLKPYNPEPGLEPKHGGRDPAHDTMAAYLFPQDRFGESNKPQTSESHLEMRRLIVQELQEEQQKHEEAQRQEAQRQMEMQQQEAQSQLQIKQRQELQRKLQQQRDTPGQIQEKLVQVQEAQRKNAERQTQMLNACQNATSGNAAEDDRDKLHLQEERMRRIRVLRTRTRLARLLREDMDDGRKEK